MTTLPGTAPARRAYPPSPPPFDASTVGGSDPYALRVQTAAKDQHEHWRKSFSPDVSPEDRRDSANWFSVSDAALALKPALDAARAHADEAQAKVDAAVKGQRVPLMSRRSLPLTAFGAEPSAPWTASRTRASWFRQRGI